jgi:hypothetical protein
MIALPQRRLWLPQLLLPPVFLFAQPFGRVRPGCCCTDCDGFPDCCDADSQLTLTFAGFTDHSNAQIVDHPGSDICVGGDPFHAVSGAGTITTTEECLCSALNGSFTLDRLSGCQFEYSIANLEDAIVISKRTRLTEETEGSEPGTLSTVVKYGVMTINATLACGTITLADDTVAFGMYLQSASWNIGSLCVKIICTSVNGSTIATDECVIAEPDSLAAFGDPPTICPAAFDAPINVVDGCSSDTMQSQFDFCPCSNGDNETDMVIDCPPGTTTPATLSATFHSDGV